MYCVTKFHVVFIIGRVLFSVSCSDPKVYISQQTCGRPPVQPADVVWKPDSLADLD